MCGLCLLKSFTNIINFYISTLKIYFIREFKKFVNFPIVFFDANNLNTLKVNIKILTTGIAKITTAIIKSKIVILFSNINEIMKRIKDIE